jgi:DNA-binding NtrC family response regulator
MACAPGAEAALTLLAASPFEVVVSDIAMPGIDGAALMKIVCERYPAIVRIVLSAPQEMETALRASGPPVSAEAVRPEYAARDGGTRHKSFEYPEQ